MAFHLNVQGSYPKSRRTTSAALHILSARSRMRLHNNVGYLESPRMHVMSAVLMFFFGLTMASVSVGQLAPAPHYDWTPTGSIAVNAAGPEGKHRSCE